MLFLCSFHSSLLRKRCPKLWWNRKGEILVEKALKSIWVGRFCPLFPALKAIVPEGIESDDVQHPTEIVAGRHQSPFAAHLLKTAHQEMGPASPMFQRAKRMFDKASTFAHFAARAFHARTLTLYDSFIF